jgi:hypothetical protein
MARQVLWGSDLKSLSIHALRALRSKGSVSDRYRGGRHDETRKNSPRQRGYHAGATKKQSIEIDMKFYIPTGRRPCGAMQTVAWRITGWRYPRLHMGLMRLPHGQHAHQSAIAAGPYPRDRSQGYGASHVTPPDKVGYITAGRTYGSGRSGVPHVSR